MAIISRRLQRDPQVRQQLRYPETPEDWRSWAQSLPRTKLYKAMELDEILKRRGRKGIHDPELTGVEREAVQKLLDITVPHWNTVTRPPSPVPRRRPEKPKPPLQDYDSALPAIGGRPER
jgi:hypothetical protein